MKVKVDKDKCIGCGACTAICPDVFEFDDDGFAKAVKQEINEEVKTAEEGCPTGAITTEE
ncbi:MAG: ferredoxin [Bacilli bacterium]|nr:ferredoxin [Bacilli bacterium]